MHTKSVLGVSVGESFAEFSLFQNLSSFKDAQVLGQKRSYLPRESLKTSLQSFLAQHQSTPPEVAIFSLRFLEKILDYRLGGSVAQIVTAGFENWIRLRSQNTALPALSSAELIFPVQERMNAQGQVEVALQMSELQSISDKLKNTDCKRVCVHFLHAPTNSAHETMAADFFKAQGFEVFVPEKSQSDDEVSRWRKNTLNASVSGTFQELKEQILEATQGVLPAEKIFFLASDGSLFQDQSTQRLSSLFAVNSAMSRTLGQAQQKDVLYLGLEKFILISGKEWRTTWPSSWGLVECSLPETRELSVQPTSGLNINFFEHLDFSTKVESWEPGPMLMGRGQKPTMIDLWCEFSEIQELEGLKDRVATQGQQRFKNTLMTLWKSCRQKNTELDKVANQLRRLSAQTVLLETLLHKHGESVIIAGPLAPLFRESFKKDKNLQILDQDFVEARATALAGVQALEALS